MLTTQNLGPRAYLKSLGFVFDKKPHQIERQFKRSLSPSDQDVLETIWATRSLGFTGIKEIYLLPKTLKQSALMFSRDHARAVATLEWFDRVVTNLQPRSIIEMGCGAGFLLGFLQNKHPGIRVQGIDEATNLVRIGSELSQGSLLAGDYLTTPPDGAYELIISDFGIEPGLFEQSTKPHAKATCANIGFCPSCSDNFKRQFDSYLQAWRRWGSETAHLAVAGRFSDFGMVRAFVLSAAEARWKIDLGASTILVVEYDGVSERFPSLVFNTANDPTAPDLESVARYFFSP